VAQVPRDVWWPWRESHLGFAAFYVLVVPVDGAKFDSKPLWQGLAAFYVRVVPLDRAKTDPEPWWHDVIRPWTWSKGLDENEDEDKEKDKHKLYKSFINVLYVALVVTLIVSAGWVLVHTVQQALIGVDVPVPAFFGITTTATEKTRAFSSVFPDVLGGVILVIVLLELVDTVWTQLTKNPDKLTPKLVRDFIVIGIVFAIRHILVVGAELSLPGNTTADNHERLDEFRTNVLFVGVLVAALLIALYAEHKAKDWGLDKKKKAQS
jgi:hypothetical protein